MKPAPKMPVKMPLKMIDRVAIVTGGGRGIGAAVAQAFAREGARVVVASRTVSEVDAIAASIAREGGSALAVPANVAKYADAQRLVELTRQRFGRVDVLVNAAGVHGPIGPLWEADVEAWTAAVSTNLLGTFHCCHAVLPHLIARGRGKIVNFSGGGATSPRPGFSAYGASKAAVVKLTETLAEELKAYNIQANAIAPGLVATGLQTEILAAGQRAGDAAVAARRLRETGEGGVPVALVAALAVFLASDAAAGLTGRLIAAPHDDWTTWSKERIAEVMTLPWFTLRRMDPFTLEPFVKKVG